MVMGRDAVTVVAVRTVSSSCSGVCLGPEVREREALRAGAVSLSFHLRSRWAPPGVGGGSAAASEQRGVSGIHPVSSSPRPTDVPELVVLLTRPLGVRLGLGPAAEVSTRDSVLACSFGTGSTWSLF